MHTLYTSPGKASTLTIVQCMALLQILHAAIDFVQSVVFVTTLQGSLVSPNPPPPHPSLALLLWSLMDVYASPDKASTLTIVQCMALLQILHAAVGFVQSVVFVTTLQRSLVSPNPPPPHPSLAQE